MPATAEHEAGRGTSNTFKAVGKKVVALTFDDGPWRSSTDKIVSSLKRYDADATFFMLGAQVKGQSARAKAVVAAGNEAARPQLGTREHGAPEKQDQLRRPQAQQVRDHKGHRRDARVVPAAVRVDQHCAQAHDSAQSALRHVIWTADTLDWRYRNAGAITVARAQGRPAGRGDPDARRRREPFGDRQGRANGSSRQLQPGATTS